jgi:hypothetical protein
MFKKMLIPKFDRKRIMGLAMACLISVGWTPPENAGDPQIMIDFSQSLGKFKPVNGVNGGPFNYGHHSVPIAGYHADAGFPSTRLHDASWPHPDAVDVNTIFPLFHADPDNPDNYNFEKTDDYLLPIIQNQSEIIYRLGVSIEHLTHYYIAPPADYDKWAKICINIIRHYNDGWANGFHYHIKYWEIWNEPEGKQMWTGTQEQYLKLYGTAATAIKAYNPALKVGGPASTGVQSVLMIPFLDYCRDHSLPLDFFSWHLYSSRPGDFARNTRIARAMLDDHGYRNTESFLDEWHFISSWTHLTPKDSTDTSVRESFERSVGPEAAAFAAHVLMLLQDCPLDVANYYCADYSPWSMFGPYGVPSKTYFVFKAYHQLINGSDRVLSKKLFEDSTVFVSAGKAGDGKSAAFMVSNTGSKDQTLGITLSHLPGKGKIHFEIYQVDKTSNLELSKSGEVSETTGLLKLKLPAAAVELVKLTRS